MRKNKKQKLIKALFKKYSIVIIFFVLIVSMSIVTYTWGTNNWWFKVNSGDPNSSLTTDSTTDGAALNDNTSSCARPEQKEGEVIQRSLGETGAELSEEDKLAPKIMADLNLVINNKKISPASFLIPVNLPTFIKFTSADNQAHEIIFDAPELQEASLSIAAGSSQGIVFNIPVSGEYKFHCSTPGHKKEVGKMIVK